MSRRLGFPVLACCLALLPGGASTQAPPLAEKQAPPRLARARTDAYGDPLPPGALARLGTARFRHTDQIFRLTFSPDGKRLFSSGDNTLRVWDTATRKELRRFKDAGGFQVSPDGKLAGEVLEDDSIRLWEVASGKEVCRFAGHPRPGKDGSFPGTSFVFCPDGKTVISCNFRDGKGLAAAWDAATGKELRRVGPPPNGQHLSITFSPDRKVLAQREEGNSAVRLWDTATGKELVTLERWPHEMHVQFAPDGQTLAAVEPEEGVVHLWQARTGKHFRRLRAPAALAWALPTFSPDSRILACAGEAKGILLWNLAARSVLRKLACPKVHALTFSPNGKRLASSHADGNLRLWETATGKQVFCLPFRVNLDAARINQREALRAEDGSPAIHVFPGVPGTVMAFSPDGKALALACGKRTYLLDAATGEEVHAPEGHGEEPRQIVFAPDDKRAVTLAEDRTVCVWETATGRQLHRFTLPGKEDDLLTRMRRAAIAFADGKAVVALADGEKKEVRLWDVATGKLLHRLRGPGDEIRSCAFAPDGRRLAVAGREGRILAVDVRAGKALCRLTWPALSLDGDVGRGAATVAFAPSGTTLAAGGYLDRGDDSARPGQSGIRLWEVATGKEQGVFPIREGVLQMRPKGARVPPLLAAQVLFSADGRYLAVGGAGSIRLWALPGGQEVRRFGGPEGALQSACFSPDGKFLAAHTANGQAWLWEVPTGTVLCRLPLSEDSEISVLGFTPDGNGLACGESDTTVIVWDVAWLLEQGRPGKAVQPAPKMEKCWEDLAHPDAAKGYQAISLLAAQPAEATALLKAHLRPFPPVAPKHVERLLADLGDKRYVVRERAGLELEKLGDVAWPGVRRLLKTGPPLEVRRRVERILEKLEGPVTSPELIRTLRAIEALERIGSADARQVLQALARGAAGHRITTEAQAALHRLTRRTR
jgi:WD40 repeat protein